MARSSTLSNHSGRGSPAKPGWVGTKTCARVDSASAKPATGCDPPPPCKTRMGRPLPRSSRRTVKLLAKDSLRLVGVEEGRALIEFIELDLRRPRAFYAGEEASPPFSGQGMGGSMQEAPTTSSIATA